MRASRQAASGNTLLKLVISLLGAALLLFAPPTEPAWTELLAACSSGLVSCFRPSLIPKSPIS